MATPSTTQLPATPAVNNPTSTTTTITNTAADASPATAPPASSLYVGELSPDVTEIFNQIGAVASIRVCRDAVTRRSLGYAYVNYHNPADGDRALESLNFYPIKGRPCRIMWSQRDPSMRKKGFGNVFIKNLDKAIDSKTLCETFASFGNILSCKVAMDENGSKGYGYVHYETLESAEEAIKAVNGMLMNDKKVFVGIHVPRRERESKEEEFKKHFTNIFVKNLPESVDEAEFQKMFTAFGEVSSAALSKDEAGVTKGFGFVNFVQHEDAEKCVDDMNGKEIDGKAIFVGRAQKKTEREDELRKKFDQMRLERLNKYQGVNLYVKNLDETIDDERLRQEFGVYGTITSARVMRDEKGESKGFAFVCFSAPEEATKAVTEMNNKIIGTKPVYVALAQRRDARRSMLEAQYNARNQMRQQGGPGMIPMYGQPMYPPQGAPMPQGVLPQGAYMGYPGQMAGVRPGAPYMQQQAFPGQMPQGPPRGGMPRPAMPRGGMPPQQRNPMMYGVVPQQQQQMTMNGARMAGVRPAPQQQQQQQQAGFKYNNNVRNASQPPAPTTGVAQTSTLNQEQMLATQLAKMDPTHQRQMIGERLYPLIQNHRLVAGKHEKHAGKITGMLLEMEVSELLHLLESTEALDEKLVEAVAVLEQYLSQSAADSGEQQ